MTTKKTLATAALTGLFTASLLAAAPAFAGENEKGACSGASGCKGKEKAEKSECKGHEGEKAGCEGKEGEKSSCSGASSCSGKSE